MQNLKAYESRRVELKRRYLDTGAPATEPVGTGGVDHLALICSDIDATIQFYTDVLKMRLTRVIPNHDDPTSTHIFLDMGGGNRLAFFDFPEKDTDPTVRGVGSMHHVALKATSEQYRAVLATLKERDIPHDAHGSNDTGSVYLRDPDNILVEVTTGY